jgi:glycosyltransferase involved in cell wall biosynthesis
MSTSVIAFLPVYNEEARIRWVLDRFEPVLEQGTVQELLAVDDGSTDATPEILRGCEHCTVITHPTRRGIGDAIRSAYQYALERDFEVFMIMAGNGKDDPAQINRVVEPILSGESDYVQGSRFLKGGVSKGLPTHRSLAIRLFTWTFSFFLLRRFTDCANGFRAYRTAILRDPRIDWSQGWLHSYELEYYMHFKVAQLGYRLKEVPVSKVYRRASSDDSYSKMRARDWLVALKPLFYLRLGLKR